MFERWNFTVCSVIHSSRAIRPFVMPWAARPRISVSRVVSPHGTSGAAAALEPLDDVAADDLAQQRAERDRVHRLRDHAVRAGLERLGHPGIAHVLSEQQHPGPGRLIGDVAQTRDHVGRAVRVVDQDDVGLQRRDLAAERRAAVETADDLEAGRLAQRESDRVAGQRVVGDDEQAPHGRAPAPRRQAGSRTIPFRMSNPPMSCTADPTTAMTRPSMSAAGRR